MCWYTRIYRKHVLNKLQTYCDGRFNMVVHFYTPYDQTVDRWQRAPLTAISLQAVGSPKEAPPTYIAKMWWLKKLGKNVIFSQNHTETNSDDWTITKKTTRTIKHENFSKMKILKVDRWALSLSGMHDSLVCTHAVVPRQISLIPRQISLWAIPSN